MMVKTLAEFREEMRNLREEMFQNAENADIKLLASWVDRLTIALEDLSVTMELLDQSVETISESEAPATAECCCPCCCAEEAPKKKARPAKKKKAKAAKKKKRR